MNSRRCDFCGYGRFFRNTQDMWVDGKQFVICLDCKPIVEKAMRLLGLQIRKRFVEAGT